MRKKLLVLLLSLLIAGLTYAQQLQPAQLKAKVDRILSKAWKELSINNQALRRSSYVTRLDSISTYDASSALQKSRRYWYDVMDPSLHIATGIYDHVSHYRSDSINLTYVNTNMFAQSWSRSFDPSSTITRQSYHKHSYDTQNNVSIVVDSTYNASTWSSNRTLYNNYNFANYPTEIINQDYDATLPGYVNHSKVTITYNITGEKVEEAIIYFWNGSNWDRDLKLLLTYDSNGNVTQELYQVWTGFNWADYLRTTITINTSSTNEIHEFLEEEYDFTSFSWKNNYREIYEFDASGRIIRYEEYEWDDSTSGWEGVEKRTVSYNTSGNTLTVETTVYYWDNNITSWSVDPSNKYVDHYDTGTAFAEVAWPDEFKHLHIDERTWLNVYGKYYPLPEYKFIDAYAYEYISGSWNLLSYEVYYYAPSMSVAQIPADKIKIYPNPAQTQIFIELSGIPQKTTFELYDLTGRKMLQTQFENQTHIDVQHLPAGIYTYKLFNETGQANGKLLIE